MEPSISFVMLPSGCLNVVYFTYEDGHQTQPFIASDIIDPATIGAASQLCNVAFWMPECVLSVWNSDR